MASSSPRRYSFDAYIRHGRLVSIDGIERKFNPYHDPRDGRFTFAGAGTGAGASLVDHEANHAGAPEAADHGTLRQPLSTDEYNKQAKALWAGMKGDPSVGFHNNQEASAAGARVQQQTASSDSDVEAPEDLRDAVVSVADSTRKARIQGDQDFEKTLTFERGNSGDVVIGSLGLVGPQGGSIPGVTPDTIAVAHVHYAGMEESPFLGDNSSVRARGLPSFVIEGETGTVWEVGRQGGKYVQRTVGKNGKVGSWQPFAR